MRILLDECVDWRLSRDIVGHESEAVSRNYTHIDAETKRAALDKLPELL